MRKTKIVCTMGPREQDDAVLAELVKEMDVARFNFSHGTHESHLEMLTRVRAAAEKEGRPIAMLLDTKGPEIRTGLLAGHKSVKLKKGKTVTISYSKDASAEGDADRVFVTYPDMAKDLSVGNTVLIDDGAIELKVEAVKGKDLICQVITGGTLSERKGVNLPGINVGLPDLTEKDYEDITFGLENGFDYIAASFVRNAATIGKIRKLAEEHGSGIKIIAKIESKEGIDNLEEIIDAADGVMVARGDLGVEVQAQMIPQLQREMISRCNEMGKIVITATQMLDSMMRSPRPTRAEVTDVANAVYEGSDAVMLSGETASGEYPVEALKMMVSITEYTEQFAERELGINIAGKTTVSSTTCMAAVASARKLKARAILAPTTSGSTVLQVSKCRPTSDIFAFSPDPMVVRQMMLFWGVKPMLSERAHSTDELMDDCLEILKEKGLSAEGDILVFIAGVVSGRHSYQRSQTNTMKIIEI
ncbi:MAG: pyruvate kinase [Mogibacterium sp.]|nr:pyruvate kinase [Mogibacterium sp.]